MSPDEFLDPDLFAMMETMTEEAAEKRMDLDAFMDSLGHDADAGPVD